MALRTKGLVLCITSFCELCSEDRFQSTTLPPIRNKMVDKKRVQRQESNRWARSDKLGSDWQPSRGRIFRDKIKTAGIQWLKRPDMTGTGGWTKWQRDGHKIIFHLPICKNAWEWSAANWSQNYVFEFNEPSGRSTGYNFLAAFVTNVLSAGNPWYQQHTDSNECKKKMTLARS